MIPTMSKIPSGNLDQQDDEAGSNSSRNCQSQSIEIETRTFEETPVSFTKIDAEDDVSRTSDINLGYDIIADYSSSVEDGINLMADAEDGPERNDTLVMSNADELDNSSHEIPTEPDPIEPSAPDKLNNEAVLEDDDMFQSQIIFPDIIPELSTNVGSFENNADRLTPFTEAEMASLYYNQELHQHGVFVDNFIEIQLRTKSVVKHPLHELLNEYLNCRDNLRKNKIEFNRYLQDYKQLREQIWILDTSSLTEHGECQVRLRNCTNINAFDRLLHEFFYF